MALFDQSQFDPQSFLGGQTGWLQQALQSGLLGRALGQQTPMQPQTGLTGAQGNYGSMGGVPFPIAPGPDPYAQQAQLPPNAQPAGPAQQQQVPTPQLFGSGLAGKLQNALAPLNPQAAQVTMSRQLMQAQLDALMQTPGMTPGRAMAMLQNPALQAQYYGATKLGPGEQLVPNMGAFGGQSGGQTGASNTTGLYDPQTLDDLARRYIKTGDTTILQNAGMGTLGQVNRAEILKRVSALAPQMGLKPEGLSAKVAAFGGYEAGQKTLAEVSTRMGTANIEAGRIMPLFAQAVKNYGNGKFPTINEAMQAFNTQTGDPKVVQLGSYLNALTNTYARGISTNPRGPTDSDKQHFRDILSKFWSPAQIDSGLQAISQELQAAHDSVPLMKNQLDVHYGAGKQPPQAILGQAQAAIKGGASRNSVIQRLEENGYDASGL